MNLPMQQENPYAPPATQDVVDLQAPSTSGWYVEANGLYVKPVTVLPKVDLSSGETSSRMTMEWVSVRMMPTWLLGILVLCVFLALCSSLILNRAQLLQDALVGLGWGGFLCIGICFFCPSCTIRTASRSGKWRCWLTSHRRYGEFFRLRGVHPKALAYLRELQSKREAQG